MKTTAAPLALDPSTFDRIEGFSAPPTPRQRPVHALVSAIRLILNKDDTRQVFEVTTALSKGSGRRLFERFVRTPYGRRVVTEPVKLEDILSDFPRLRAMPSGSVGKSYVDFMDEAGFTPQGLLDAAAEAGVSLAEYPQLSEFRRAFTHLEVSHDLWHVLTGYGRDPVGELCNLVFSQRQTKNPGLKLIIAMGIGAMKLERWSMPVLKAAKEAKAMGDNVDFLLKEDVEAMLAQPLAEVRARLGIFKPEIYDAIPSAVKHAVLRPKVKATQTEREQTKLAEAA